MGKTIPLLRALAAGPLPKVIDTGSELDALHVLRGAGWVVADWQRGQPGQAIVREVTFAGRAVLEQARRLAP